MDETNQIFENTKQRMQKSIDALVKDLSSVRTGRASTGLVENINVDYYGTLTPINQLSSISIPEARLITIQPWDQNALIEIEKALSQSDLGFNPTNDGEMIRINVPALTEERRKEMVKSVGGISENTNVSLRNITDISWDDAAEAGPAVLAMIAMPFTYSISNGIALAFVSYAAIKICTGKFNETSPAIWVIAVLSLVSFAVA